MKFHCQTWSWTISSEGGLMAQKMASSLWNQFQTKGTTIRRPDQVRPRRWHLHRIVTWHYVHDGLDRRRLQIFLVTLLLRLERDFPTKLYTDVYQRESPLRPASSGVSPFEHIAQETPLIVEPNTPFLDTPRIEAWSFHWWVIFSTKNDSRWAFIWRRPGVHKNSLQRKGNRPLWGKGILVLGVIMLGSITPLHVIDSGSVSTWRCKHEVAEAHVRNFRVLQIRNSLL